MTILRSWLIILEILELWLSPSGLILSLTALWLALPGAQQLISPIYEMAIGASIAIAVLLKTPNDC